MTLRDSEPGQIRRECTQVKVYFKKCDYQNVAEFFPGFLRRKICKYSEGIEDSLEEAYLKKKKKSGTSLVVQTLWVWSLVRKHRCQMLHCMGINKAKQNCPAPYKGDPERDERGSQKMGKEVT